mgnify:FL=1
MQLLEQTFGSKNSIKVLRQLAKHENWEFNITELARDININKGVLSRLIKKLNENNIIKINQKGKIMLFKINKENTLIRNLIIPAFKIEDKLFDEFIKPRILKLKSKDLLSIILYGSYAKGDFKLTSDLDLLIIIKNKNDQLENEINELKKEFLEEDLLVRVDLMTLKEFKRLYKLKEPLLISIEKNHKILYGSNLNDLIK